VADAKIDPERLSLNKWEMHKALECLNVPKMHLPETSVATADNLIQMLHRCETVYVKPVGTWGGRRITRIQQRKNIYIWQEQGHEPIAFGTESVLREHFKKAYENVFCIVQAAAPIRYLHGRPFDLRLLMQRNIDDEWVVAGTVVRIGGKGAIVSNVGISNGEVIEVRTLCQRLKLSRTFSHQLDKRLKVAGFAICNVLAKYRHFNEVGIDFGLSHDNSLWVIEVNTDDTLGAPSHALFAKLPNKKLYKEIEKRAAAVQANTVRLFLEQVFGE
jgi:hypothetical protein